MGTTKPDFIHRLLLWAILITLCHFVVVLGHLWLVVRIQPSFPRSAVPWLIFINLLPVGGVMSLAKGYHKSAAILIAIPLAVAFVIGTYSHFLSPGTDNVLRMAPGELTPAFQVSAALLVLLEPLGCWVGLKAFTYSREKHA
jgi:hypothetical protein